MTVPTRFPEGLSNAAPWQLFSEMGVTNPFYYHSFFDDFDVYPLAGTITGWEVFGTGTRAFISADGGVVELTTAATTGSYNYIQRQTSTFQPIAGKKLYFVTRVSLTDIIDSQLFVGIVPVGDTPSGSVPNGIWITKALGSTQLSLVVVNNSVITTNPFPALAYTSTNNVFFDVGFSIVPDNITGNNVISGSVAPTLVSYVPQSGTGTMGSKERSPVVVSTAPLLTTLQANVLAPTVGLQTESNVAYSATFDFVGCFRER
jgi:hypothetical protein